MLRPNVAIHRRPWGRRTYVQEAWGQLELFKRVLLSVAVVALSLAAISLFAASLGECSARRHEITQQDVDAPSQQPPNPGLNITLGSGLRGNGSTATPLDLLLGTSNGQAPTWNGSTWGIGAICGDPSKRYCFREEFERGTSGTACSLIGPFVGALSGTGATCSFANSTSGHPGVLTMETGSTTTGGVRESMQPFEIFGGGAGQACVRYLTSFNALSTTTTEYLFRGGFAEPASNADSVDAVQAIYDRAASGNNKWRFETSSNSTRTTITLDGTGGTVDQPISAGTWYTIEICVDATAANATIKVNDVLSGTITTNIPTGTTRATSVGFQCFNNNGTAPSNQLCFIDYVDGSLPFGVAR